MQYIGICDDEKSVAGFVKMITAEFFAKHNVSCEILVAHNPRDFLENSAIYDLVIMDINLRSDIDGVQAIYEMRKVNKNAQVIFLTAYDHRSDALNTRCQYLFKPFDINVYTALLEDLLDCLPCDKDRVRIETTEGFFSLNVRSLYYFKRCDMYTKIITMSGIYKTKLFMKQIEEIMGNYPFSRCHASYYINTGLIRKKEKDQIIMTNGDIIPISRRKSKDIKF